MGQVVQSTGQNFWHSPNVLNPAVESETTAVQQSTPACQQCASEFMIGAHFCHSCGLPRPPLSLSDSNLAAATGSWSRAASRLRSQANRLTASAREIPVPTWLRYLHFHEIKQAVGLPTASLIAFLIGLGCIAGAVSVGLIYKASNLSEFQAIQMWRIEWLLAGTASFVAGILLKTPSKPNSE